MASIIDTKPAKRRTESLREQRLLERARSKRLAMRVSALLAASRGNDARSAPSHQRVD